MSYATLELTQTIPCFPNATRGQPSPLKTSPDGSKLIYALNRTVVIRDIVPPAGAPIQAQLYTAHGYDVTSAAMSPSGCYMASGDKTGVVRVWACDNPDQILKLETAVMGGAILDIAWSPDNQRVAVVGDGREIFGKVFMWDSGNSVGEISGHAKKANSISFKSSRPYRIATGGEDFKARARRQWEWGSGARRHSDDGGGSGGRGPLRHVDARVGCTRTRLSGGGGRGRAGREHAPVYADFRVGAWRGPGAGEAVQLNGSARGTVAHRPFTFVA